MADATREQRDGGSSTIATTAAADAVDAVTPPPPPLVLHFDINKTLVISDPVRWARLCQVGGGVSCCSQYFCLFISFPSPFSSSSGVETDAMINSLLSECSWGVIEGDEEALTARSWRLLSAEPSPAPPPGLGALPDALVCALCLCILNLNRVSS